MISGRVIQGYWPGYSGRLGNYVDMPLAPYLIGGGVQSIGAMRDIRGRVLTGRPCPNSRR